MIQRALGWIAVAVLVAPVAVILTIVTAPLWSWVESSFGIESIGHSGPADWCYVVSYSVLLLSAFAARRLLRPTRPSAD